MSQSLFTGFQASLFDPLDNLPVDLRKDIETGWASDFRLLVLPEIVRLERMFAPLYSSRRNTRPSTPTYILLSLLVLAGLWTVRSSGFRKNPFRSELAIRDRDRDSSAPAHQPLFTDAFSLALHPP